MEKIPLKVRFALKILGKYCEKFYWCQHCPLHAQGHRLTKGSCSLAYDNPYKVYYDYFKKRGDK